MKNFYVHGYDVRESTHLQDQASTLVEFFHSDTVFTAGGNANIDRGLYPLLKNSAFKNLFVLPCMVCVDSSKPQFVDGFIKKTFKMLSPLIYLIKLYKLISPVELNPVKLDFCTWTSYLTH